MSYPINYPTPQGANIQIFKEGGSSSDWVKPQGASFVWFTLIGAGGSGDGATGGGSGAVTNFMGPAFLMPDALQINVGKGQLLSAGTATTVVYQQKDGNGYILLNANPGEANGGAAAASPSNNFSCMGFYQSIAGQAGGAGTITASSTTFLGGGGQTSQTITGNYGYSVNLTGSNNSGIFQMQPIIVGVGGAGNGRAGIGCGGGIGGSTRNGGDGIVVIITW